MTTVTYEVPVFKNPDPEVQQQWSSDQLTGNRLLRLVIDGDSDGIGTFLADLAAVSNAEFDAANARADLTDRILKEVDRLAKETTLTGFKAHKEGKSWNAKLVTAEGEECEGAYCSNAAKFHLPAAPEGAWHAYRQACGKHAIDAIEANAITTASDADKAKRFYLTSAQHRMIKDQVRDALKSVTA